MDEDELTGMRLLAEKQARACERMRALNGGVGLLGIKEPEMFDDFRYWQTSTENDHADTVLLLLDEIDRLRALAPIGSHATDGGNSE